MSETITHTVGDRVKLPYQFDVARLQAEVQAVGLTDFVYYDPIPLRAPAHLVDSSLPPPSGTGGFADGTWTDWLNTPMLNQLDYLREIVELFQAHTRVTLVRLLRLAPGATVQEHTDPTLGIDIPESVIRLTIPIFVNDQVDFFLNNEVVPMQPGECWYLRLTDPHRIINHGSTERINLTIDMAPNDWVRAMIVGA